MNGGLWKTIERKRALSHAKDEMVEVEAEMTDLKARLSDVKSNPATMEHLVRSELGYLRPGEKEVRFLKKQD